MPTEASIQIAPGDVAQIVESVFETMMNLQAGLNGAPWFPGGERITSVVHLSGDWNGAVLVECDHQQACRFAGRFLSIDPPTAVDNDVRDVLGELANMIGGNLKSMLTRGIRLSMPSVIDGSYYNLRVCGAQTSEPLAFQSEDGSFWVTLITTRAAGAPLT